MTEIILHGLVSKKFKSRHKFHNIKKPVDCIKAIDANYKGFKNFFLNEAKKNMLYEIIVDGDVVSNANQALEKKEIKKIDIVPAVSGSGPALVAFAVNLVIGLIMAGIQYLMTPIPENEPKAAILQVGGKSFFFSNKENTTQQYTPVPVGYGALRVGSKVISTQVNSKEQNEDPVTSFASNSAGGAEPGGSTPGY